MPSPWFCSRRQPQLGQLHPSQLPLFVPEVKALYHYSNTHSLPVPSLPITPHRITTPEALTANNTGEPGYRRLGESSLLGGRRAGEVGYFHDLKEEADIKYTLLVLPES